MQNFDHDHVDKINRILGSSSSIEGSTVKSRTSALSDPAIEKLYSKMVKEVSDYAILLLDLDGNILNWNLGAAKIKGYTAGEIIGLNFRLFYTSDDRNNKLPEKLLSEAAENGRATHEGWRLKKDGSKFWGSVVITALHDDNGNLIAFSKLTRDLTEKKISEEMQQRNAMDLEFKNEELRRSEERYHRMIAEIEDYAIILLDNDGKILNWNKGAQSIKGYSAKEIVGRNFSVFYLQDDINAGLPQRLLDTARTHNKASHEGWRVRSDGKTFWGMIVITALHDNDNNIIGFSKVTRDLTERKNAEERMERYAHELQYQNEMLHRSEERYHRMIAEVEDYAIILLDQNGDILNWNKGAEAIKGYKESEVLGQNFSIFYLPEDLQKNLPNKLLEKAVQHNKATHEGWRKRKDGTKFWGSIVITALHGNNNEIIGFSKVTRDLTQKKAAEDYILRQNKQLEEYAYVTSHDLQEPLRKINLFSDLLEEKITEKNELALLQKIKASASRMTNLIKGVLQYSQVSSDSELKVPIDLNKLINEIEIDFELLLQEKQGRIIRGKLPKVKGIPIQIHQLFSNLISNSIKFNDKAPEIKIAAVEYVDEFSLKKMIKLSFQDNGIGFRTEHAERIFQLFRRLEGTVSGTGIGLALCKRIVEGHGGTISASGVPGEGSTFEITLAAS